MTEVLSPKGMIRTAALLGFSAVLLGAFGAHALKASLTAEKLAVFETGCRYHFAHALALLALAGLGVFLKPWAVKMTARCWTLGVLVFSGSLYLLAVTGVKRWGMVTPIGGFLLLLGWLILFWGTLPDRKNQKIPLG